MGAWGPGSFDNDDAGDWVDDFANGGVSTVRTALSFVTELDKGDYLEAPEAAHALAAADLVAAARDGDLDRIPPEVRPSLAEHADDINEASLVPLARQAVARVLRASELKELWEEQDDSEWEDSVRDLLERLKG